MTEREKTYRVEYYTYAGTWRWRLCDRETGLVVLRCAQGYRNVAAIKGTMSELGSLEPEQLVEASARAGEQRVLAYGTVAWDVTIGRTVARGTGALRLRIWRDGAVWGESARSGSHYLMSRLMAEVIDFLSAWGRETCVIT